MKDDLQGKTNFNCRRYSMEENIFLRQLRATFDERRSIMKKTFDGRQHLMEDIHQWRMEENLQIARVHMALKIFRLVVFILI